MQINDNLMKSRLKSWKTAEDKKKAEGINWVLRRKRGEVNFNTLMGI
jgi:hypothetical protein